VLKALEDAGRVRRGYFAGGVGATQFALPPALELLRSLRQAPDEPEVVVLSATDPANPYGTTLRWPQTSPGEDSAGRGPTRSVGARVVLVNGALAAYLPRGGRQITVYLPEDEPSRSTTARALASELAALARDEAAGGLFISEVNGRDPGDHALVPFLVEAGFHPSPMGLQMRVSGRQRPTAQPQGEPVIDASG
jgi:ATP-dependent Lhr-like helicase